MTADSLLLENNGQTATQPVSRAIYLDLPEPDLLEPDPLEPDLPESDLPEPDLPESGGVFTESMLIGQVSGDVISSNATLNE